MKNFDPLRGFVFDYITVVAEITLGIAVIGSIFARDAQITYFYFFMPFFLALICMIPCLPTYIKEDMTVNQILFQRVIELIVLELAMIFAVYLLIGDSLSKFGYIAMLFSTAFFEVLSYLIRWFLEKDEADRINSKLEEMRLKRAEKMNV